ncbi:MAG: hypothetical protein HY291_18190 [Planctomycetes bacterium]|nr:hypothetical protein [Planctomycetota bacterium]
MSKMLAPGRRVPALAPFGACGVCGPGIRVFRVEGERGVRCRGCGLTANPQRGTANRKRHHEDTKK